MHGFVGNMNYARRTQSSSGEARGLARGKLFVGNWIHVLQGEHPGLYQSPYHVPINHLSIFTFRKHSGELGGRTQHAHWSLAENHLQHTPFEHLRPLDKEMSQESNTGVHFFLIHSPNIATTRSIRPVTDRATLGRRNRDRKCYSCLYKAISVRM